MGQDQPQYGDGALNAALEIEALSKSYGEVKAVNGITFSVERGALFAFLGANGAGKSTTINMICSILKKDGGRIVVGGHDLDIDPFAVKREIGVVFQTSVLDGELTVRQNLEIRTAFYPLSRGERRENLERVTEMLDLGSLLKRPVKHLSGGQLRRVDIARAMVHRPRLLILDEPTTGLDPKTRLSVWSLIDEIRSETGMTVFLTTHYLEEAEKATDVVIMDRGSIIARGTPNELKNRYSEDRLLCYRPQEEAFERLLEREGVRFRYEAERGAYCVFVRNSRAKELLVRHGAEFPDVEIVKGNMDDVFLNVTGRSAEESHD